MTKGHMAKQARRQALVNLKKDRRDALKLIIKDLTKSDEEKVEARNALNQLPRNSSSVRLRNRCKLTGRPRGYLRKFQMSRICFREFANSGLIPGIFKASW